MGGGGALGGAVNNVMRGESEDELGQLPAVLN